MIVKNIEQEVTKAMRKDCLCLYSANGKVRIRDKKGWTQRVGLANVSPKGLYHGIRGWFKLDSGS